MEALKAQLQMVVVVALLYQQGGKGGEAPGKGGGGGGLGRLPVGLPPKLLLLLL